jgi:hypothetical protein
MATDQVPPAAPPPTTSIWARWGRSGRLLAIGGAVGIVAVFLPLMSATIQAADFGGFSFPGMNTPSMRVSQHAMVLDAWQGKTALAAYIAAVVLAVLLYPPTGLAQKNLAWAGLALGALAVLLALWLLTSALRVNNDAFAGAVGFSVSVGFGAYINVLAAATVLYGGYLKAREERLV